MRRRAVSLTGMRTVGGPVVIVGVSLCLAQTFLLRAQVPRPTAPKDAEPIAATANRAVLDQLPFSDRQDFEDAKRGFIATVPDERSSQRSRSRP